MQTDRTVEERKKERSYTFQLSSTICIPYSSLFHFLFLYSDVVVFSSSSSLSSFFDLRRKET